ncbi:MAG: hypothetical protein K8H88_12150 [Sandaracinaceae bacterium]|nr:hypothetical protein [Sandaracinaceae bacterium]
MGEVKGSAITARIRFIRERSSEDTLRSIRAQLAPEHQALLAKGVQPHEWVPFELFVALSVEIDRVLGTGDLALCRELGAYAARVNLPTLYRIFYRIGSLSFILEKAARLWSVHYGSGRMEVETGDRLARLRIVGFDTPHRAHCLSVLGWAESSAQQSGVTVTRAEEIRCRTRGDEICELALEWK